jgi:hypothetical protein
MRKPLLICLCGLALAAPGAALADTISLGISREAVQGERGAAGEARGCGTERLGRITATIKATGISCRRAHGVVHAVEEAPLSSDILETPYLTYSRPYSVSTEAGRFTCRREPFGLAGSEHNMRCRQGRVRVSWYTIHE